MQKYERLYAYIHDYQRLIYDFYSKHAIAFLTTYYNISTEETVWDDEDLLGGSYEPIGELSGIRWNKYLLLPVYFIEDVSTIFSGEETGYIKEGETSIVIPSTYGITPLPRDIVKLEQAYLRPTNDVYPIFSVTGVEKSVNADRTFWKLKLMVEQSRTTTEVEQQLNSTYVFYDYNKQIHSVDGATFLTNMLIKNETLRSYLKDLFDDNCGFYLV